MNRFCSCSRRHRRGSVIVLSAFLMTIMMGMVAFAMDLGFLVHARTELQRSADSSALASVWALIDDSQLTPYPNMTYAINDARGMAAQYAAANPVLSDAPYVDQNPSNLTTGDVVIGHLADVTDADAEMVLTNPLNFNAVQVRVQRTELVNGEVQFFFAGVLGSTSAAAQATATAAFDRDVRGFQTPGDGSNLGILPFALDEDTWNDLLAGLTDDDWFWDKVSETISSGSDGVLEVNLFPQGTGSPGNRGTIDIGSNNNSTNDIARQILDGVSPADMAYHGGKLEFDENGELFLNGDTGISAGVKDELDQIKGEPRIIPIFREVNGPGNNAMYTIVKFVGIRIMEVKLTGQMSQKRVIIQPARMISKGTIPSVDGTSDYVYSYPRLIR